MLSIHMLYHAARHRNLGWQIPSRRDYKMLEHKLFLVLYRSAPICSGTAGATPIGLDNERLLSVRHGRPMHERASGVPMNSLFHSNSICVATKRNSPFVRAFVSSVSNPA